jgi:hypothetical protein
MPEVNINPMRSQVELLRSDISELELHFENWDSRSTSGGRRLRSIAGRIILSARRLEKLVKENTYST